MRKGQLSAAARDRTTLRLLETVQRVLRRPRFGWKAEVVSPKAGYSPAPARRQLLVEADGHRYTADVHVENRGGVDTLQVVVVTADQGEVPRPFFEHSFPCSKMGSSRKMAITLASKIQARPVYDVMEA